MRHTCAIAFAAIVASSCGGGSTQTADTGPPSETLPATSASPEPSESVAAATTVADGVAVLELGEVGFATGLKYERPVITAAAEVVNTSGGSVSDIEWSATLIDANGSIVSDARGTLNGPLGPGETTWIVPSFRLEAGAAPVELQVDLLAARQITTFTVANGALTPQDAMIEPVSAKTYLDINGEIHVEAAFRNTGDARLTSVLANCGVYVDDSLVGGAWGFINEMLPGGDAGMDTSSGLIAIEPLPSDVRCDARPVNISTYEPSSTESGVVVQAGMTFNPGGGQGKFYDVNIGATVFNPTDQTAFGVRVEVDILDGQGRFVHLAVPATDYVLPGETYYTGISSVMARDSEPPASLRARVSVDHWGDGTSASLGSQDGLDLTAVPFDVSSPSAYIGVGLLMFGGTITNRSAVDIEDAVIGCTAMQAGAPVGGGYWTLGVTPVNEIVPFEIITSTTGSLAYDDLQCTVHLTSISKLG
ncbi:MAG: hypothetical protein HY826_12020 [Actinobacteria bacterium]|nr:hypothetical protein [Actinomycetota bacterium]